LSQRNHGAASDVDRGYPVSLGTTAAVLVRGNANGRKVWRGGNGRMLRDIQDARAS